MVCIDLEELITSIEAIRCGHQEEPVAVDMACDRVLRHPSFCASPSSSSCSSTTAVPWTPSSDPSSSTADSYSSLSTSLPPDVAVAFSVKQCIKVLMHLILQGGYNESSFGKSILSMHMDSHDLRRKLTREWNAIGDMAPNNKQVGMNGGKHQWGAGMQ